MANFDIIVNAVDKTKGTFQGIERSLKGIQGLAVGVGTALAGAFSVKQVVDAASAYQKLQVSLTGAVGAAKSTDVFNQLNAQASTLGVSVDDLTGAFKNLKSTGLDTSASSLETWTKLAVASGTTVENIADAIGNAYQGSFGKISKATNDLIDVQEKYGQYVIKIAGVEKARVNSTGEAVTMIKKYAAENQNYADALDKQSKSISASYSKLGNAVSGAFSASGLDTSIAGFIQKFVDLENRTGAITKTFTYLAKGLEFVADNFKLIGAAIAAIGIVALGGRLVILGKQVYDIAIQFNKWIAAVAAGKVAFMGFTTATGKNLGFIEAAIMTVKNAWAYMGSIFSKSQSTFGAVAGAIAGAGLSIGIFGSTLLKLGGLVLRFLGGPWGLLISGILLFKDEIADAGRKALEFFGILDKQKPASGNISADVFARTGVKPSDVMGGRGKVNPEVVVPEGDGINQLTEFITGFSKALAQAKREADVLKSALQSALNKGDLNLASKLFEELSNRLEQFGIVAQKDAALIMRDFVFANNKAQEENRRFAIQLTNTSEVFKEYRNEVEDARLGIEKLIIRYSDTATVIKDLNNGLEQSGIELLKQNVLLGNNELLQKKWDQEIRQTANSLTEQSLKIGDANYMQTLFRQELIQTTLDLQQQELRLGMASKMAQKFALEIQANALALKENALKLADANYQQGLFNQSLTGNRQALEQQKITLELLNKAFADGNITLQEYAALLGNVDSRLLGVTETTRKALDAANATVKSQDNSTGAVKELTSQLRAGTITWRQYEQAVKNLDSDGVAKSFINVTREIERAKSMAEVFAETLDGSVRKAGDALADSLTEGIMKGKLSLNSFKDFFGSILNDIAAMIIKKQFVSPIVDALTGAMSGGGMGGSLLGSIATAAGKGTGFSLGGISDWFSSAWGGISDFFGGFFADGGYLPAGQFGIAGEAGPELITGPANIVPMDKLSEGNQPTPIVNFQITAIDTQSGVEFLLKNKPQIIGMVQQGFNSQGKRGIYR